MSLRSQFTSPFRQLKSWLSHRAVILHYHRITELPSDPYRICVTPGHFAQQLEVLMKYGRPISLKELVNGLQNENLPKRSFAITFDDGYADNLYQARPLLERWGIPASVFVTTSYLDSGREFWWDELEGLLLQPGSLPRELSLSANGLSFQADLPSNVQNIESGSLRDTGWDLSWQDDPSPRHTLFRNLYDFLYSIPGDERIRLLDTLFMWAGRQPQYRSSHRIVLKSELQALAKDGLVDIGSHTVNHPVLAAISTSEQQAEIRQSKTVLEEILGRPVAGFAFPHGSGTAESIEQLRQAGYSYACCSIRQAVRPKASFYQLPRISVKNWDGETFSRWLGNWF